MKLNVRDHLQYMVLDAGFSLNELSMVSCKIKDDVIKMLENSLKKS